LTTQLHAAPSAALSTDRLLARKAAAMPRGASQVVPVFAARALGSELWDTDDRRYIDFAAGIAVCNTGHLHPHVNAAVRQQLERFSHSCIMVTPYESAVTLAERLNAAVPGPSPKKTMFFTTGAEAVENAVKIARAHTGRPGVIAFTGAYHGRTLLTMGLNGKVAPYGTKFGPFPASIHRAAFPCAYHGVSVEAAIASLEMVFKADLMPADCAAIIVEPVQGEGGFYPAPAGFLERLRAICDAHGIMLILDEVQTGFARTGRMFASEYADVEADIVTLAKGMAGGFPLSAITGRAGIMDAADPGGLGGTYAGSPIGCAAALAVLDVIAREDLCARALHIGMRFRAALDALKAEFPQHIADVRAERGAMVALELVESGRPDCPAPDLARRVLVECHRAGLIVLSCGLYGNVVRFLPALTIPDELLGEGLAIFAQAFRKAVG
jgi:4-aminobutyrate aminotransferase/(S)-3-amino-2-methylpropionate transaminase